MTSEHDPIMDRLLRDLAPPQPPPDLRSRVLEAARTGAAADSRTDLWSRLWNSRGLRLAWAAAVALLLMAHVALDPGAQPSREEVQVDPTVVRDGDGALSGLLRPVRISYDAQPLVGRGLNDDQIDSVMEGTRS